MPKKTQSASRLEDCKYSSNIKKEREVQGIQLPPCLPHMCPMQMYGTHCGQSGTLIQHLTKNNILYNYQHAFRSKRSTETQLTEFTEDMLKRMKDGKQSDVCGCDGLR